MTIREAIAYADAIQDNEFDEAIKCRWLSECEARIWRGVMLRDPMEYDDYEWQYDADRELMMPPPYDELYQLYLSAKIYLAYHEAQNYQNAMAAFNKLFDQTVIWYAKTYDPAHGGSMEIREIPTVVQGETVTVSFSLPYDAALVASLRAVLTSGGSTLVSFDRDGMALSGEEAAFTLTQLQSLTLPVGIISVAIAGTDADGNRFEAWPPLELRVVETGIGEVL